MLGLKSEVSAWVMPESEGRVRMEPVRALARAQVDRAVAEPHRRVTKPEAS